MNLTMIKLTCPRLSNKCKCKLSVTEPKAIISDGAKLTFLCFFLLLLLDKKYPYSVKDLENYAKSVEAELEKNLGRNDQISLPKLKSLNVKSIQGY